MSETRRLGDRYELGEPLGRGGMAEVLRDATFGLADVLPSRFCARTSPRIPLSNHVSAAKLSRRLR